MKAYAIKDPKGKIKLSTVKEFKDECKDSFVVSAEMVCSWSLFYQNGYRCVPVEITETRK